MYVTQDVQGLYNVRIAVSYTHLNEPFLSKIVVNNIQTELVNEFDSLDSYVSYKDEIDIGRKIERFTYISGTPYSNL